MNTTTRPARENAIATMNADDDRRIAAAQEQRARPSALANMANRLNISQQQLMATLKATVFKGASDNEFAALIVVADAYKLNPLLKEIYAFPVKGGGIAPMVSIDGWIKITNDHPQFDGIEFKDMADDKGKLYAIEATIYRKDRNRPVQIIEYLEECKRNTDPWNKSPARMLRHRALMQCARYAFGFSGIGAEDDGEMYAVAQTPQMRDVTPMPTRGGAEERAEQVAEAVATGAAVDATSGEFIPTGNDELDAEARRAMGQGDDSADDSAEAVDFEPIFNATMAKINNASSIASLNGTIKGIPADMPEGWQSSLRERAFERDTELRAPK